VRIERTAPKAGPHFCPVRGRSGRGKAVRNAKCQGVVRNREFSGDSEKGVISSGELHAFPHAEKFGEAQGGRGFRNSRPVGGDRTSMKKKRGYYQVSTGTAGGGVIGSALRGWRCKEFARGCFPDAKIQGMRKHV